MKYVLVVGSVMSGIGKGTVASSIGVVLKKSGYRVTAIKIDPYLNLDSGTISPFEHGECYVLEDGGETDLDLGNYERFLHIDLTRNHNITTGKIYQHVLHSERRGDYLGKTVQIVPHITDAIQDWIRQTALVPISSNLDGGDTYEAEICLIELGGTVGDLESDQYTEALRQLRCSCPKTDFFVVNVCYLPDLRGELKTKPTQNGLSKLRECGLDPDLLVVRSQYVADETTRRKLVRVCNMGSDRIIMNEDLGSIYRIPILFSELGVDRAIIMGLRLEDGRKPDQEFWEQWQKIASKHCVHERDDHHPRLKVAIIGKYTGLSDSYLSLIHAIKDAACCLDTLPELHFIEADQDKKIGFRAEDYDLALIPGGFGSRGTEEMLSMIKAVREQNIPTLGICLGFQLMVVEWCRNIMGITNAISEEVIREQDLDVKKSVAIIRHLSKDCEQELMGGTMKLGIHPVRLVKDSLAHKAFSARFTNDDAPDGEDVDDDGSHGSHGSHGNCNDHGGYQIQYITERFRHRYGLAPEWTEAIEASGMRFTGVNSDGIGQICEIPDRHWYMGVQFHPEYRTRPLWPHVLFLSWIRAGLGD